MSNLRPRQIVREIGRAFPNAWQQIKSFRAGKGKDLPDWPDWCYLPIAAGMAIATQGYSSRVYQAAFSKLSPAIITAAASWRVSQGVYQFDADLYNSLVMQPLDGNLPCDVLKRLPEWCVYVETMGAAFHEKPIVGFWAHLEYDVNDGRTELRFALMAEDGENIAVPVHLGDWTLEEGLERMKAEAEKHAGMTLPEVSFVDDIVPLLQLVLYLCAENVDMPRVPVHPIARTRMSGQVDTPKEPQFWTVGERIGAEIRKHRNVEAQKEAEGLSDTEKVPGTHTSPRPHIRRAHWHHYWTGPREGERKLILRWLPPIPVGIGDNEDGSDGPIVIHKVK